MTLPSAFQLNLVLMERFNPGRREQLIEIPLKNLDNGQDSDWKSSVSLANVNTAFIFGISEKGEEYLALKPWLEENAARTVIFLVDEFTPLRAFMESLLATEVLTHPQVIIKMFDWPGDGDVSKLQPEIDWFSRSFSVGKIAFFSSARADTYAKERFKTLRQLIQKNLDEWLRTYYNYLVSQDVIFSSFYSNLQFLLNAYSGQGMFSDFKNIPAIICGAGPSLEQHLDTLKGLSNRALIFGSGSALNILSRHHIQPHFAGGIDPTSTQLSRISTNFAFQVPFFYTNRFNHEALNFVQGDKLFVRGGSLSNVVDWFAEQLELNEGKSITPGVSTSNFCMEVACALGCNPIILVGMDLSYRDLKRYSPGVTAHPSEERKHHEELLGKRSNLVTAKIGEEEEITTTINWLNEAECFTKTKRANPEQIFLNATEGGMPIAEIENMTLEKVMNGYLQQEYDLDLLVHESIQSHEIRHISKVKLSQVLERWILSLKQCHHRIYQRLDALQDIIKGYDLSTEDLEIDLEAEILPVLGDTPAAHFLIKQLNDIFNCMNGKDLFRIGHYPEMILPGDCKNMLQFVEVERCKLLLQKLEMHHLHASQALSELDHLSPPLKSNETLKKTPLMETKKGFHADDIYRLYYYSTGELYSVKRYRKGVLHGTQEYFFVDGTLRSLLIYKDGVLDGGVKLNYSSGKPKRGLYFRNGRLNGIERMWNENGVLIWESEYEENRPIGKARSWYENGVLAREVTYFDSSGYCETVEWDKNGNLLKMDKAN